MILSRIMRKLEWTSGWHHAQRDELGENRRTKASPLCVDGELRGMTLRRFRTTAAVSATSRDTVETAFPAAFRRA